MSFFYTSTLLSLKDVVVCTSSVLGTFLVEDIGLQLYKCD